MTNITIENGDLLAYFQDGKIDVMLHCANCQNTMNSGIAKQIRERYPAAYEADCRTAKGDPNKLGTFSFCQIGNQVIFNCYAQQFYGYDGKRYLSYDALDQSLANVRHWLMQAGASKCRIGIPFKMGSDRAGGDWDIVKLIIEKAFEYSDIHIVIVNYNK